VNGRRLHELYSNTVVFQFFVCLLFNVYLDFFKVNIGFIDSNTILKLNFRKKQELFQCFHTDIVNKYIFPVQQKISGNFPEIFC